MKHADEVHSRIIELEAQVAELKAMVSDGHDHLVDADPGGTRTSRRRWLAAGGVGVASAAAMLAPGGRVAAADPDDVVKDVDNAVSGRTTLTGGRFHVRDAGGTPVVNFDASLAGIADGGRFNGVIGSTRTTGGYGMIALADRASGARAQLQIEPNGPPPLSSTGNRPGELAVDETTTLWFAAEEAGGDLSYRTLSGPGAAGAYYPLDPVRLFDSRVGAVPNSGIFSAGTNRLISLADGYDSTGAVTMADVIAENATAVSINITVTGTTGPNFVSITPGDATAFTASSINWSAAGQSLANGVVTKLGQDRFVRVFCGDQSGSTHVIIDASGYYI